MNLKYIFTDEILQYDGHILHRIKALKSFGNIHENDLGGWIEKEENLSQKGNCWVANNAKVYDNARIYDNAIVCGEAKVYNNAKVHDYACVEDESSVYGNADVFNEALIYDKAKVNYKVIDNEEIDK